MNRRAAAERDARAAAMVRAGMSAGEAAQALGCCKKTVYVACERHGMPRTPKVPVTAVRAVRNVHASMFDAEWDGVCLYHRALEDACRKPATWYAGAWQQGESQAQACDEHREALACRVRVRRRKEAG